MFLAPSVSAASCANLAVPFHNSATTNDFFVLVVLNSSMLSRGSPDASILNSHAGQCAESFSLKHQSNDAQLIFMLSF